MILLRIISFRTHQNSFIQIKFLSGLSNLKTSSQNTEMLLDTKKSNLEFNQSDDMITNGNSGSFSFVMDGWMFRLRKECECVEYPNSYF